MVSVPLRGSDRGKGSLRKPYQERVSDAKSTHQIFIVNKYQYLRNKQKSHRLKPLPWLQSTHVNEKMGVSAIARRVSIVLHLIVMNRQIAPTARETGLWEQPALI
ncbi:MAG TPA: hypothetical protein V6D12_02625 [Candidatus Obscuribacterales bacterium]